jgi:LPXTG-motif cell wall-anchored protein
MLWLGIALGAAVLGASTALVFRRKKKNASGAHLKT